MAQFEYKSSVFRDVKVIWERNGGAWKQIINKWEYFGGVWRDITPTISVTISSDQAALDLKTYLSANTVWSGATSANFEVTISSGTVIGASSSSYALIINNFPAGCNIKLIVGSGAYIVGKGGKGANYVGEGGNRANIPGYDGDDGGHAIRIYSGHSVSIENWGTIAGGGGGGGSSAVFETVTNYSGTDKDGSTYYWTRYEDYAGGAGGGGAGANIGPKGNGNGSKLADADNGTLTTGGWGDGYNGYHVLGTKTNPGKGTGGAGGDLGLDGVNGANWSSANINGGTAYGGSGGTRGYYMYGNSYVTWLRTGTRLGRVT